MSKPDNPLRRRLAQLQQDIKAERQQDITRAVEFRNHGDNERAQYHTGLADGRNSMLATLRALTSEYPADRMPVEACPNWGGHSCPCSVLGIGKFDDESGDES